jgi:hypothetical protein
VGKTVTLTSNYGGADLNNYTITDQATTSASITPKALTVGGISASDRVYDGGIAAAVSTAAATLGGLVSGDDLTVAATGAFDTKDVGVGKTVTLTSNYGGADLNNYTITDQATTSASITPKALTVSGISASDRVYDGGIAAAVSTAAATLGGLVSGDDLSVAATGVFDTRNVGTGKTVTLTSSYGGADLGNYVITGQASTTASISARTVTVSGITAADKVYDGTLAALVNSSAVTLGGLVSGDDVGISTSGAFANRNVGNGKSVTLTSSYSGADAGNYIFVDQLAASAAITPATLSYNAAPVVANTGSGALALSGTVSGLVTGDTLGNATTGVLAWTTPADAQSGPGNYAINGSGLAAQNYVFVQAPGNASALLLTPGSISVTQQNVTTQLMASLVDPHTGLKLPAPRATAPASGTPGVQVVDGGVRLPDNMLNVNP